MTGSPDLDAALALLRSGDIAAADALAQSAWRRSPDVPGAVMLSMIAERQGRADDALSWLERARALEPRNPRILHQLGVVLWKANRNADAVRAWREALVEAPDRAATWLALGRALIARGDDESYRPGLVALRKAAQSESTYDAATDAFVQAIKPVAAPLVQSTAIMRTSISIVMCTIDGARADRAQSSFAAALGRSPHEFVVIEDPPSLAAGYDEGMRRAQGSVVVFAHDDVEVLVEGFGERLLDHLQTCDIVGIAGATEVRGPAWAHAGHPYLHGAVGYPLSGGYEAHVYSTQGPLVPGMKVLDGVLLTMRRDAAIAVGWDAAAFDSFHGYDVDFCLRAHARSLRLGVATDLGVLHHSLGRFGDEWRSYAARLMQRNPALNAPVSERTYAFARKVSSRDQLTNYFRGFRATLAALALDDR